MRDILVPCTSIAKYGLGTNYKLIVINTVGAFENIYQNIYQAIYTLYFSQNGQYIYFQCDSYLIERILTRPMVVEFVLATHGFNSS